MMPIPKPTIVNTGGQHLIQPTIDDFFRDTADYIKKYYGLKPGPSQFEIISGEIVYLGSISSDDRVTYLKFLGMPVALVMETRTEFNHVQYTFFRNLSGIEELVSRATEDR